MLMFFLGPSVVAKGLGPSLHKFNLYFLSVPRVLPGKLAACICAPNIQVDFTARSIPRCWVGGRYWGGAGEVLGRREVLGRC